MKRIDTRNRERRRFEIREGLKAYSNWPTFPQLYVNGELIGGCDIAVELHQSGELAKILGGAATPATAQ